MPETLASLQEHSKTITRNPSGTERLPKGTPKTVGGHRRGGWDTRGSCRTHGRRSSGRTPPSTPRPAAARLPGPTRTSGQRRRPPLRPPSHATLPVVGEATRAHQVSLSSSALSSPPVTDRTATGKAGRRSLDTAGGLPTPRPDIRQPTRAHPAAQAGVTNDTCANRNPGTQVPLLATSSACPPTLCLQGLPTCHSPLTTPESRPLFLSPETGPEPPT